MCTNNRTKDNLLIVQERMQKMKLDQEHFICPEVKMMFYLYLFGKKHTTRLGTLLKGPIGIFFSVLLSCHPHDSVENSQTDLFSIDSLVKHFINLLIFLCVCIAYLTLLYLTNLSVLEEKYKLCTGYTLYA